MAFYEETVLPNLTCVTASFHHWLSPIYRDYVELDFDDECISAFTEQKRTQWNRIQSASFLTRNEMREAAGYSAIADSDEESGENG